MRTCLLRGHHVGLMVFDPANPHIQGAKDQTDVVRLARAGHPNRDGYPAMCGWSVNPLSSGAIRKKHAP